MSKCGYIAIEGNSDHDDDAAGHAEMLMVMMEDKIAFASASN